MRHVSNYAARVIMGVGIAVAVWMVILLASLALGSVLALDGRCKRRQRMWVGLALLGLVAFALSLVPPHGAIEIRVIALVVSLLAIIGLGSLLLRRGRVDGARVSPLVVTMCLALPLAGWMALGEVTNYDTGLYHLQVIALQADEGVRLGLASLHDRFGFSSSLWSWGAIFERAVGSELGFRLVSGLFLSALVLDVVCRLTRKSARRLPGTSLVLIAYVPLTLYGLSYAGRTFSGIGQDWILAILWVVATAYALDFLRTSESADIATGLVVAAIAGTVRPIGWILVLCLAAVWLWRLGTLKANCALSWWAAIITGLSVALVLMRDVLASGWLLFPLETFPVPVAWRIRDPEPTAQAITSWARSPFNTDRSQEFFEWFPPWITRALTDWVVLWALTLCILSALFYLSRCSRVNAGRPFRLLLPLVLAQLLSLLVWFLTAPDPRFAWGPLLCLSGLLLIGSRDLKPVFQSIEPVTPCFPVGVLLLALLLSLGRDGSWWWDRTVLDFSHTAVPLPTVPVQIGNGIAQTVGPEDRCWRTAVPCVPWYSK